MQDDGELAGDGDPGARHATPPGNVHAQGAQARPFATAHEQVVGRFIEPDWVVRFYNRRGTAEQYVKEGKHAFHWTRLSCRRLPDNKVRLQLHALAHNLATLLRCIEMPEEMADWSLTSLQLKLIKIGARVVRHARAILAAVHRLRAPPSCA